MLRRQSTFLAILFLVSTTTSIGYASGSREEFSSSEGRFSAWFPNKPAEEVQTLNSPIGQLKLHIFMVTGEKHFFCVGYCDYPYAGVQTVPVSVLLDGARDGALENLQRIVKATLLSEKSISLNGYPGREIKVKCEGSKYTVISWGRYYLVENRLYSVAVTSPVQEIDSTIPQRFLDSFQFWNSQPASSPEHRQEEVEEYTMTAISRMLSSARDLIQDTSIIIIRAETDGRIPTELSGLKSTVEERVEAWGTILGRFQEELVVLENKLLGFDNMSEEAREKLGWEAFKLESATAGFAFRIGVTVGIQKLVSP
ncbi:MAG: hypothetical protein A2060_04080 [Planctomycetes bacterium GWA2_50_13]|nr:MAG: hypothetical protein A2060_04080 [Planctomycetes bacterium GWA2_50_13]OHB95878.1 MAG: hypothetical protein A3I59_01865 [Planctomycetes bacterium RIFCSPLOWO2_02_FULL_50_16]OHC03341.1 MAG: hypothetical protein A3G17_00090 [Planctomycetes bacterium RIFCSPLOWO2_12_FULL_50_35]HCN19236.1 hypothetical protein [Planctomycetia bacterium]